MAQYFADKYVGTVLDYDATNRTIKVFIPELLPNAIKTTEVSEYSAPINSAGVVFPVMKNAMYSTVKKINYVIAKNWNADDPMPEPGSKVMVYYLESNPQLIFWKKFNPNNDYKVIPSENNTKLITININNSSKTINENDNLTVSLPDYLDAVLSESTDDNTKKILTITEKTYFDNKTLSETINELKQSLADDEAEIKTLSETVAELKQGGSST